MRKWGILLLLIVLLWIGGYLYFQSKTAPFQEVTPNITFPTGSVLSWSEAQAKLLEFEKQEAERAALVKKDNDIQNEASQKWDTLLCENISDVAKKTLCKDTILLQSVAPAAGNLDLAIDACSKIETLKTRDECYDKIFMTYALKDQNISYCEKISDTDMLSSCKTAIEKKRIETAALTGNTDINTCANLEGEEQTYCQINVTRESDTTIMDRAMTDKNPDECQKIQNEELKTSCNDAVVYDRAMTDKNIELCDKILEEWKRNSCTTQVVSMNDANQFQSIVNSGDRANCATLWNEDLKNKCSDILILRTVATNPDKTLCDIVIDEWMKAQCTQITGQ